MNYEAQLENLNHSIRHARTMIDVCDRGGFPKSRAIYSAWLDLIYEELEQLNAERLNERLNEVQRVSIEHKEREGNL
jgi:hypothetical protein